MKRYKLKIKDGNEKWDDYGLECNRDIGEKYVWLKNGLLTRYCYNPYEKYADEFTEEDINKLPYGFIQQHELIEVEEELYNIVCPYTGNVLIIDNESNLPQWSGSDNLIDTVLYKRQFTLKEIEDKYPILLNWAKKFKK